MRFINRTTAISKQIAVVRTGLKPIFSSWNVLSIGQQLMCKFLTLVGCVMKLQEPWIGFIANTNASGPSGGLLSFQDMIFYKKQFDHPDYITLSYRFDLSQLGDEVVGIDRYGFVVFFQVCVLVICRGFGRAVPAALYSLRSPSLRCSLHHTDR